MSDKVKTIDIFTKKELEWLRHAVQGSLETYNEETPEVFRSIVEESGLYFMKVFIIYPITADELGSRNGNIHAVFPTHKEAKEAKESTYSAYTSIEECTALVVDYPNVYILDTKDEPEGPYPLYVDLESGRNERVKRALDRLTPTDIAVLKEQFGNW